MSSKIKLLLFFIIFSSTVHAAEISFNDVNGNKGKLSDFRGKWVVLNYWATWCPPCLEEIPELEIFHEAHKDKDAVVIGLNMETIGVAQLKAFIQENFISYPVIPNINSQHIVGKIPGLPTTYLISPQGEVVASQVGAVTAEMIETYIKNNN
jgi:thiol-disulfide isomerase/thioredoxin